MEIRPCPFCGSDKTAVYREPCPDGDGAFISVQCRSCHAQSRRKYASYGNDCPQTYSEAKADWNRRATERESVSLRELVDWLEERVDFPTILSEHLLERFEIRRKP